jgi:uncharacterized phiE125 gp8 family phage protein
VSWITTPSPFRSITRVVQPAVEPVSLFDVKAYLGIVPEVAEDDDLLMGLIAAARIIVEERLHQTTTATRWRAKLAGWHSCACSGLELPYPPVLWHPDDFPVEVRWKDRDGNVNTLPPESIEIDAEEIPGRIHIRESISNGCCESVATIEWWAGVQNPTDVRSPIRTAIKRLVGQCYTTRGDTPESVMYRGDSAIDAMLASCSTAGRY